MKKSLFAICLLMGMSAHAVEMPMTIAVLRGVDKITGRVSTMQAPVGQKINFGHLTINVEKCYTRSPEETPENSAFLSITEKKSDGTMAEVFTGWMFSSNPALSAMEHAGYDIWVISCKSKPVVTVASSAETNVAIEAPTDGAQADSSTDTELVSDD